MSLSFGPQYLDTKIESAEQVTVVTEAEGEPAQLSEPVVLHEGNKIAFKVAKSGRYRIIVRTPILSKQYPVILTETGLDPSDPRQYATLQLDRLKNELEGSQEGVTKEEVDAAINAKFVFVTDLSEVPAGPADRIVIVRPAQ